MLSLNSAPTPASQQARGETKDTVLRVRQPELTDADILSVLFGLFAGRTQLAFGEAIDWWAETLQCDLAPEIASRVALVALSKWPFDQRAGAPGVKALQDELLKRARMLIERSLRDTGEVVL